LLFATLTHQQRNAEEVNVGQPTKLLKGPLGDPGKQRIPMMIRSQRAENIIKNGDKAKDNFKLAAFLKILVGACLSLNLILEKNASYFEVLILLLVLPSCPSAGATDDAKRRGTSRHSVSTSSAGKQQLKQFIEQPPGGGSLSVSWWPLAGGSVW